LHKLQTESERTMTHAERARIKRQMSIGSNGENDLNRNEFRIERYIVVHGNKFKVIETSTQYCAQVLPGRHAYGDSIEQLRENAVWSLDRAQEEAREAAVAALAEKEKSADDIAFAAALKALMSSKPFWVVP
jgi:hypothetical protein